jgi:hypothetical protein
MFAWRFGERRLIFILSVFAAASLIFAQLISTTHPTFDFYLLPTRAWEILVGAITATRHSTLKSGPWPDALALHWEQGLGLIGILLILASIYFLDVNTPFPGIYAIPAVAGAALVISFARSTTWTGKMLGHPLLTGIGLISYSAYLWHQPLLAFARVRYLGDPPASLMIAVALSALPLAYLTWRYVERPFRDRALISRNRVFASGMVCSLLLVCFGVTGSATHGFEQRIPESIRSASTLNFPKRDDGWCFYDVDSLRTLPIGPKGTKCYLGAAIGKKEGLLFGDSFAAQYDPFWDVIGKDRSFHINSISTNWCYPSEYQESIGPTWKRSLEQCAFNRAYVLAHLANYDFVILSGYWGEVYRLHQMSGVKCLVGSASSRSRLVVIMPSPKQFDENVGYIFQKSMLFHEPFHLDTKNNSREELALLANRELENWARKYPNVIFLRRDDIFTSHGHTSDITDEGLPFSLDGIHISVYGSKMAAKSFQSSSIYQKMILQIEEQSLERGPAASSFAISGND